LTWSIPIGDTTVSAEVDGEGDVVFVCGHGAGGSLEDRPTRAAAKALRTAGLRVVRFNFVYSEKKTGRPDPMPKLKTCIEHVVAHVRRELAPRAVIIGGRSLGGRAASMLAADGFAADGLLLLAYPLHPPGQHEKLRDAHLASITMPVLCFSGTRDEFCDVVLMRKVLERLSANWTMHWLDGADHSFHVLKSSGRTDPQVMDEVATATAAWLPRAAIFSK
jgi:uncharacterized protein